jgi:hypothetical protein
MKERPILFSGPMVRAILDGTKTQTRRVVMPSPEQDQLLQVVVGSSGLHYVMDQTPIAYPEIRRIRWDCPYGQPGDQLWVRETFADLNGTGIEHRPDPAGPLKRYAFASDHPPGSHGDEARKEFGVKWTPSIHMPRGASRISLEITGVRVERLQDIGRGDAEAEGWNPATDVCSPLVWYVALWESLNGPGSWSANPWVWVLDFKNISKGNT